MGTAAAAPHWIPQHHRGITLSRLQNFVDDKGLFRSVSLQTTLYERRSSECVKLEVYSVPPGQPFPRYADVINQTFRPTSVGESFGPLWSTHWFRVTTIVPADWKNVGFAPLVFVWDSNCEAMLYLEGQPVQSFTDQRFYYTLDTVTRPGATYSFYVELAANVRQPDGIEPPDLNTSYKLAIADLAVPNQFAWEFLYDFIAVADMARALPEDSDVGMEAMYVANKVVSTYRRDSPATWPAARKLARAFLSRTGAPERHQVYAVGHCHIDTAWLWPFEETHRKVARSWVSQLVLFDQFPQHIFACSQAQQYYWLREDHPELFARVQAAAKAGRFVPTGGAWVEMDANVPSGESIVRQFLFGQRFFEAAFGARSDVFWLPDTFGYAAQLPQLAHGAGMKYFLTQKLSWNNINVFPHNTFYWQALDGTRVLTHFPPANTYNSVANVEEIRMSVCNNKDKDRANASLLLYGNGDGGGGPTEAMLQSIERLADVDGLPRVKIASPSQFFKDLEAGAQDLLSWQGELYFELHRGTYTTHAFNKASNRLCERLLREVELLSTAAALMVPGSFSYPKAELDSIWRDVLLFQFHDVLPGSSVEVVYVTCVKRYKELVPQLHRLRAHALAALAQGTEPAAASSASRSSSSQSFGIHDIQGARALGSPKAGPVVANSLPFRRRAVVEVPAGQLPAGVRVLQSSADGAAHLALVVAAPLCLQRLSAQHNGAGLLGMHPEEAVVAEVEGGEAPELEQPAPGGAATVELDARQFVMQNRAVRAIFDLHGRLISLYDKAAARELVPPGGLGNRFRYYEDQPTFWDAWDVEIYHLETGWDAGLGHASIIEHGPLRVALSIEVPLSTTSSMTQVISLDCCSSRLEFACDIDWNESRRFLKVEFPWLLAADTATYETQFGAVARPTHTNTSWDWAKFEVCGHRWGDLSEPDYGVALLNNRWLSGIVSTMHKGGFPGWLWHPGQRVKLLSSWRRKYGYACHGNVMRLSLLRSPKAPDATADIGKHSLGYAIYPHAGSWQAGGVVQQGLAFNAPLVIGQGASGALGAPAGYLSEPLLQVSNLHHRHRGSAASSTCLVIETIKPVEPPLEPITEVSTPLAAELATPPTAFIVRLYEPHGSRGTARLTWHPALRVEKVTRCNLLEDDLEEAPPATAGLNTDGLYAESGVEVPFTPFTVITLKLHMISAPGSPGH